MTSDAVKIVQCLFTEIWRLFNGWYIPGTNVTPAMWAIFSLLVVIVLKFVLPNLLHLDVYTHEPREPSDSTGLTVHPMWRDL